jgi:hypothetical protein
MPKHLRIACLLYVSSLLGVAAIAPLYEVGVWRFISPMLALAFVAVAVLFMRRQQWTWHYMKWMAVVGVAINLLFFPAREFYGAYTQLGQLFASAEVAACAAILWSLMRRPETKTWFTNDGA